MSKRESAVFAVRLGGKFPGGGAGMTNAILFSRGGNRRKYAASSSLGGNRRKYIPFRIELKKAERSAPKRMICAPFKAGDIFPAKGAKIISRKGSAIP